jgi:hypothetical protein
VKAFNFGGIKMKKTIFGLNTLMALTLLLTACAPSATPEPTIDVNQLFTQAASTVIAQLTQNAPPATQIPTATKAPLATNTPLGGALPTLPPLATLPPLMTPTKASLNIADKAAYITQSPSDNTSVKTGQVFNITWRMRNTGTTTWNQNYQYRFFAAANKLSTNASSYPLTKTVPPNGEVDLTVVATAPSSTGTYDTQWVLTNPEGTNFSIFTLSVNVVAGSTSGSSVETAAAPADPCSDKNYAFGGDTRNVTSSDSLTIKMQGGQIYLSWAADKTATGTFGVTYDAVGVDNMDAKSFKTAGSKWFGEPDQNEHTIVISVTGDGTLPVKLTSINGNHSCY